MSSGAVDPARADDAGGKEWGRGMVWYQQPAEAALVTLRTSADGLTAAEASRRLAEHGPNLFRAFVLSASL